jgi:Fe-S cluster assembly protein SufD
MTQTLSPAGFTQETFDHFLASRDEPGWLTDQRREAWATFQDQALPSQKEEEWMRTDIRLLKLDRFGMPTEVEGASPAKPLLSVGVELGGSGSSLNGLPCGIELNPRWAAKGVIFTSLEQAARDHGELVQRYLHTRAVNPHFDKFASLHASSWATGTFLYVPRNVVVDQPLHCLGTISGGGVDLSHTLVVLEEGAEATFLSEWGSPASDDSGLFCGATELILQPGSRLRFVSLQDWGQGVWHFGHQKAIVDRDASLQWTVGALGSKLSKVNQHVALVGVGAESQVNGVMFTEGKQHLSYHTLQHHVAPNCRSDFLYKAALQDKSRTVWRGMIKVDPKAQKTDGYQRNDNLLLSNNCRADAIPGLQIEADDVRCTHGSTTGRVDDELVFYAMCRGFTRKEAIRMIVTGFFQQVFDRFTIESVREALGHAVARRVRDYE